MSHFGEMDTQEPAGHRIQQLLGTSPYKRSRRGSECTICNAKNSYKIQLIRSDARHLIEAVQVLLEDTFGPEEVEPIEVLAAAIDGKLRDGSPDIARYCVYVATNTAEEIVAVYAGGLIAVLPDFAGDTMMYMGAYGITRPENRRRGLIRELYISALIQAWAEAREQGKRLSIVVGETTPESEPAWNSVGRRRVYAADRPLEHRELRYVQPPLEFNAQTGLPADGAGEVPEHLMVDIFDQVLDKRLLIGAVDGIYRWCNIQPRSSFESNQAYVEHCEHILRIQERFTSEVNSASTIILLSAAERADLRRSGLTVYDYNEAGDG